LSIQEQREITCPNCGQKQTMTIFNSLNISLNPEHKNDLFAGKINRFNCQHCAHNSLIPVPFLYHDMDRKFAVHYFPATAIKKASFLKQFNMDGSMRVSPEELKFEPPEYMFHVHVVFDMNELINYIIFREILLEYHQQQKSQMN